MSKMNNKSKKIYCEKFGEKLSLIGLSFQNGYFIAITEKQDLKLGTTAISLPLSINVGISRSPLSAKSDPIDRKDITTATVIGTRNEVFAKALAEKITLKTKSLVYLSVNFQENNEELLLEAMKLIDEFIDDISI